MNEKLEAAYREASKPFHEGGGGLITEKETGLRSWRYFLEINSACNLRCPTCTKGNQKGYDHQTGIMDWQVMLDCIEKIKRENPNAYVLLYGNSEPFLHPRLPECVKAIKDAGLSCEVSSNLNYLQRYEEVLDAHPDLLIVSLSGFTQDIYVRGHQGGNIDKVKANMELLGKANESRKVAIAVHYHLYKDNEHEVQPMKDYAASLGIGFILNKARAISMENAIQYCREHDPEATGFAVQANRPDWNHLIPPVTQQWKDTMDRLHIPPTMAREMYKEIPVHPVCPVGDMFTFIRHDGKTSLCACVADRRISIGNFLETDQEELSRQRRGHSICKQCLKYRMNLYFHMADKEKWRGDL
jgi:MoaA/NifB/PqqE/SkfB family radical SAM enzyme